LIDQPKIGQGNEFYLIALKPTEGPRSTNPRSYLYTGILSVNN